ncbi:MAG: hypothetical protein HY963_01220 [Ignavibacteriales bacterium]|nr:hypothetical protein [Ignavibacteriales bacterium]
MSTTTNFDLNSIKSVILQFNRDEKIELAKYLDKLTLTDRFEKLFDLLGETPLTFEEITDEVERVREERIKYRTKNDR